MMVPLCITARHFLLQRTATLFGAAIRTRMPAIIIECAAFGAAVIIATACKNIDLLFD